MSKPKVLFFLLVIVSACTSLLVTNYLKNVTGVAAAEVMSSAVIVKEKIPEGTLITSSMVKISEIPAKYLPAQAATSQESVVNKYAVVNLWPGETVLKDQLGTKNSLTELSYKIPSVLRAISITNSPTIGVGGHIKPGNNVDVITFKNNENPQDTKSFTLLQNVSVLAVGNEAMSKEGTSKAETVTLLVYPKDAQLIVLNEGLGNKLKLILRGTTDKEKTNLKSINPKEQDVLYP